MQLVPKQDMTAHFLMLYIVSCVSQTTDTT